MLDRGQEGSPGRAATMSLRLLALCFSVLAALAAWYLSDSDAARVIWLLALWAPLLLAAGLLFASFLPVSSRIGCVISTVVQRAGSSPCRRDDCRCSAGAIGRERQARDRDPGRATAADAVRYTYLSTS